MTDPRRIGVSIDVKPHAYDPAVNPELFEGVLARRFVAFLIDVTILAIPVMFAAIFIFIFGVITLGIARMVTSMRKATKRRASTPSNNSGLTAGS